MASSTVEASQDLRRVGEIVLAAAALAPGEREAFLRQVTLSQPALLAEVRRRLELAAALPESFLAVPAAELLAVADQVAVEEDALSSGPRYEPEECVGEGGMARVHKAFDRQLRRPVALKFLDRLEPDARRRFLREAHAQARVRHESVLEVYETGELDGRPFIAMHWVDGPTLLAIRAETSLEQKVRLIAQVAEGLHAAHREGLIHRDVKPSNILVERTPDGDWKPWIADFGIALWREAGSTGRLAGTPAYLAPELLRGGPAQADRRTDVYGLGVTLYEFLTGEAPFCSPNLVELFRQVREEAPRSPREILPDLPADLAAIALKCLEKEPEARYPSARALAEDLRRFLNGDAVEAHTATRTYRLARFAVRHRRPLLVAGVAAVLLMAALAVAAALGVAAQVANRRAELRRGQAEDLIGFMLTDLRDKLDPLGKLEILDEVGKRAMGYFAAVPQDELSDEELARRSQALYQIGDVRIRQGDLAGALGPLRESLALAQALVDRDPASGERLFGLGQSHFWVGKIHWDQGDRQGAQQHFETYLEIARRLERIDPENLEWRLELAYAENNLGLLLRDGGDLEGALQRFQAALAILRELVARRPERLDWQFELAATHRTLGLLEQRLGSFSVARRHGLADLALRRSLLAAEPRNFLYREFLGTSLDTLGFFALQQGDLPGAAEHLMAARDIYEELVAHDPENRGWWYKLALSLSKAGAVRWHQGRRQEAIASWRKMRQIADDLVRADATQHHWRRLRALAIYREAYAAFHLGRRGAARQGAAQAIQRLEELLQARPADREARRWLVQADLLLGCVAAGDGQPEQARAIWRHALESIEPLADAGETWWPGLRATALWNLGRESEARPLLAALEVRGIRDLDLAGLVAQPRSGR